MARKRTQKVIGIDPGISGAFVLTDGEKIIRIQPMPLDKKGRVDFDPVMETLTEFGEGDPKVFLENPVSFGMGTRSAYNYGRDFQNLIIALKWLHFEFKLVAPGRWTKEMHEGIEPKDLKPKAKSILAVEKHFPLLVDRLPQKKKGGLLDGPVDALLIAGYGLRLLNYNYEDL